VSRNGKVGQMLGVFRNLCVSTLAVCAAAVLTVSSAQGAEHILLKNGFDLICDHRGVAPGNRIRLYMDKGDSNFIEVDPSQIAASEPITLPAPAAAKPAPKAAQLLSEPKLTEAELHQLLATAGAAHNLDVDLLASVVREESDGQTSAVSHAGAQGLMQLMPSTAAELGVSNAFVPVQNVSGGTAYLDSLLKRYNDNLALALAAYNAGPGAVDRWHGIPPYRETRLYVARVIREFNRRIAERKAHPLAQVAASVH
jgi:Transglycosylase SLT domain